MFQQWCRQRTVDDGDDRLRFFVMMMIMMMLLGWISYWAFFGCDYASQSPYIFPILLFLQEQATTPSLRCENRNTTTCKCRQIVMGCCVVVVVLDDDDVPTKKALLDFCIRTRTDRAKTCFQGTQEQQRHPHHHHQHKTTSSSFLL